jgi:hypothetical protein
MMFVQLTQLIVQLPGPDPRLRDHGFSQSAENVHLGACNPWWLKYEFAH